MYKIVSQNGEEETTNKKETDMIMYMANIQQTWMMRSSTIWRIKLTFAQMPPFFSGQVYAYSQDTSFLLQKPKQIQIGLPLKVAQLLKSYRASTEKIETTAFFNMNDL